ncbi:hypothetical protein NA56DRAFT_178339 [Hyaloscypha hepaticicola]|uniref:Uncharacterized protein n=1 Tax=Hyaloscypha hepaticicola TaxID=2082293 RepID=A0A2J6Q2B1_9HELO|nr:hypothetical protein NA56DRAFT_178339 [Hyaloscypha hepaticicola]
MIQQNPVDDSRWRRAIISIFYNLTSSFSLFKKFPDHKLHAFHKSTATRMCFSYAWQYKCGCIAPKPSKYPIHRCTLWESQRSCELKRLFSYLDVDCSVSCRWDVDNDRIQRQQDLYLQKGEYQGELSEEDYYFNRVPTHLAEPLPLRRSKKRRRDAIRRELLNSPEDGEVVALMVAKDSDLSDGEVDS